MLIYCDSVVLIYFLDSTGILHQRAEKRLMAMGAAGDEIAVSDLTRLECRVKPLQLADKVRLALFDDFFAQPDVRLSPLTTAVYDRATLIRATHAFKTPDALHLAAALEGSCALFLTHDKRLARFSDIPIEVLP